MFGQNRFTPGMNHKKRVNLQAVLFVLQAGLASSHLQLSQTFINRPFLVTEVKMGWWFFQKPADRGCPRCPRYLQLIRFDVLMSLWYLSTLYENGSPMLTYVHLCSPMSPLPNDSDCNDEFPLAKHGIEPHHPHPNLGNAAGR